METESKRCLITGANRGLGLEFCRQLLPTGAGVWAAFRGDAPGEGLTELQSMYPEQLSLLHLDISQPDSIHQAARNLQAQSERLDLLINNAGIFPRGEKPGTLSGHTLTETFQVNAIGPLLLAQEVLPLLLKSSAGIIVNLTSQLGSLARKRSGGNYSYSASKAALNMFSRALAADLHQDGIIVITVHPGWVRTDMGGRGAPLTMVESVNGMLTLINKLSLADSGEFLTWNGQTHPW